MIDISTEFNKTGMLLDKTTQSLTAFPYDFDSIKIKSNDYVIDNVINDAIKKLHYNFLYIYRGCNIGNFEVFDSYSYSISSLSTAPFFKNLKNNYALYTARNSFLTGGTASVLLPYNNITQSSYLFVSEPGFITCLKTGEDIAEVVFKTNNVDPLSGDIKFKKITDIKSDLTDNLYVVDNGYNTIYQYNVNSFVSNEFIYREKLFIKNLIGGVGTAIENNKFKNLKSVAVNKNILVAQDVGNKCFKIFDKNLNWINTSVFVDIFDEVGSFEGIILDEENNLYGGVGKKLYKFTFINDLKLYEFFDVYDLVNYFYEGEFIKNLFNIPSNSNMFYIQTNATIKKMWFTSLTYVLGQFEYSNRNTTDIKWMSVSKFNDEKDLLAIYTLKNNNENLSINIDKTYYNSLLNLEKFLIYEIDELLVQKDEYVQSFTLLSKFSKLYYNIFLLLQNIKYKYSEKDGVDFPIVEKKIYNRGFLGYLSSLDYEKNFDIGVNEIFQSSVLNRVLLEIYNLQLTLLLYIVNNYNDRKYLSPDPFINVPTSKRFIYFVDESFLLSPNPLTLNIFEEISPGAGILVSLGGAPLDSDDSISIEEGVVI